jgi:Kef-type K+ transport system membrane component KefB
MADAARILITLGGLLLAGLLIDVLGHRSGLPRVSLLVVFGIAIGPPGLDLLPDLAPTWFPTLANIALVMIGFLLGETLSLRRLREHGRAVLRISIAVVLATSAAVLLGLLAVGAPWPLALLLAAIATATAPAATLEVVHEARAHGSFSETLLGVVAVDDAWGLMVFAVAFATVTSLSGGDGGPAVLARAGWDVGGALLVGVALGVPMALVSGRIEPGEPTRIEAVAMVFLCGGIALWLNTSYLIAAMAMGAVVANFASHHTRPFHAIENIERPFLILFFVGSGATVEVGALPGAGALLGAYVVLRAVGRVVGAALAGSDAAERRWMGLALMPQAGVALGMALVATQRFPDLADTLLPVVIGGTVVFEIAGPMCTRLALIRGEKSR